MELNPPQLSKKRIALAGFFLLLALLTPGPAQAHVQDLGLEGLSRTEVGIFYLKLGFLHIIPWGLDHIFFVLALFVLNPRLKPVILQATTFTVAHSITLGLAMNGVISPPLHIVEPVIALSIFYVAIENMLVDKLKPARLIVVFFFGLIHGLGFAGALGDYGLPDDSFMTALILFNVGVELGQIAVILATWLLIGVWFAKKPWYHKWVVIPISALIAINALVWVIQRVFFP